MLALGEPILPIFRNPSILNKSLLTLQTDTGFSSGKNLRTINPKMCLNEGT